MTPRIEFVETEPRWRRAQPARKLAREAVAAAARETNVQCARGAEMTIHLVDDARIRELNKTWRGKDAPTNVLSFPVPTRKGKTPSPMLGDIVIAYETTAAEAARDAKTLRDHTAHLIAHGFLHLVGFDHESEAEAELMENAERRILRQLGIADPYLLHA